MAMDNDREYLIAIQHDLENVKDSAFQPLCFSMKKEEISGEVIDCLKRFFEERLNPNSVLDSILIHESLKSFSKEELSSCILDHSAKDEKDYSGNAIGQRICNCVKQSCVDLLNSFGNGTLLKQPQRRCRTSVCSVKNKRRKMEDRHVIYEDLNYLFDLEASVHQSFYAVFDGHGGTDAANYACSQLVKNLVNCADLIVDPGKSLKDAISGIDESFCEKAKRERLGSGAAAVAALLQGNNLTIGWLGDSQIILSKNGQAIQLMEPHKPNREDERERIENLGGCVVFFGGWRVNGTLAVSRAIGDLQQKPYVTGEPDIEEYILDGDEEFLILGCDGLWDTVEPTTAVEIVHKYIKNNEHEKAANALVDEAKNKLSMDNITVIVVFLDSNDNGNHT